MQTYTPSLLLRRAFDLWPYILIAISVTGLGDIAWRTWR